MAIDSRTSNLEKGTLPYMAPDELILKISLNTSTFQLSSMFIPYILWQFLLPFLIRGLVFSLTQNFYCEKQNTHPKRKPMHDTLALQWFSFARNDEFVFFDRETRFRPRCWIDIHRNLANNILPCHCSEESAYFGEKEWFPVFSTLDPAFSTSPRVFHRTPRFPLDSAFSTRPRVFHTPGPRTPGPRTPGPRPRVFHLAYNK